MGVFKRSLPLDQFNVVAPELIFQDFCFSIYNVCNFPKKLLGGWSMLHAGVLMPFEMGGGMGERQDGFPKRFAGNCPRIHTISSYHPPAFDYSSPFSQFGRLNSSSYTSRSTANA